MKLIQIKINLQGEIATRDIHVEEKSISKLAGTHRIVLPAIHDNILNRKYVEKKWINKKLEKTGYDISILCEPEKLEECMNLAKEERKKLLETVLIPQAKASLYAYEIELDKINKAEEAPAPVEECMNLAKEERKKLLETVLIPQAKASLYAYEIELDKINKAEEAPAPVEAVPEETPAVAPVEVAPKKRGRKKVEAETPVEKVETPVEEVPTEEAPAPVEKPVVKRRGRVEKKAVEEVSAPKQYEEMTLAELKQECAKPEEAPAPVEKPVVKRRGRVEKKAVEEVSAPKQYEEMTLAELKQECAKLGIVPASRNKEKIIAQLRGE